MNSQSWSPGQSKTDLIKTIDHFGLNRVAMWNKGEVDWAYIEAHPNSRWSIREVNKHGGGGRFIKGLTEDELVDELHGFVGDVDYVVHESMVDVDKDHLIMNGEIMYDSRDKEYYGFINRDPSRTVRDCSKDIPQGIGQVHITRVPGAILDIIWVYNLLDYVIEFSMYDIPVGIKNKNLIVWEIRRY